jgi:site-specific DNA-methyltransferase (adenine-specific)
MNDIFNDNVSLKTETPAFSKHVLPAVPSSEVYLEDCVEALKRYADNHFDLAIVDPPYGIGAAKQIDLGNSNTKIKHITKDWDNEIPTKEYFNELFRVSKNQIIWGGNYFIEHLRNTRCFIVWDKQNGTNNMADCELAWTSFETSVRMYHGHIFKGIGNSNYITIHPTQKPIKLYEWIISKYAKEGDLILDTHLGSGSSRIAAYKGGFNFVGFEIDQEYYEKQEKRFNDFKSQLRLF